MAEVRIPLYSIYKTKSDCVKEELDYGIVEVIRDHWEFPTVRRLIGEIIIRSSDDEPKDHFDILYTSSDTPHKRIPMLLGQIKKEDLLFFSKDVYTARELFSNA